VSIEPPAGPVLQGSFPGKQLVDGGDFLHFLVIGRRFCEAALVALPDSKLESGVQGFLGERCSSFAKGG